MRLRYPENWIDGTESISINEGLMDFSLVCCAHVLKDDGGKIMTDSIKGSCENTEMGIDPPNSDRIDMQGSQRLIKVSLEEGAESSFFEDNVRRLWLKVRDRPSPACPPNSVGLHPSLKDKIILQKAVAGKNNRNRQDATFFQEIRNRGDDLFLFPFSCPLTAQITFKHIDNDYCWIHELPPDAFFLRKSFSKFSVS